MLGRISPSCAVLLMYAVFASSDAIGKQKLTIRDAIETTRFMTADTEGLNATALSPDGSRYAVVVVRGDVARDGVELEVLVGSLDSLDAAVPASLGRIFTRAYGGTAFGEGNATQLLINGVNFPRWIDQDRLALLWENEHGVHQVITVDASTKQWKRQMDVSRNVTSFAFGVGGELLYVSRSPWSPAQSAEMARNGFSVRSTSAVPLLHGVVDGSTLHDVLWGVGEHYVQSHVGDGDGARRIYRGTSPLITYYLDQPAIQPTISPDGRWAILAVTAPDVPLAWQQYKSVEMEVMYASWRRDSSLPQARSLQQPFLVSLADKQARPLWDAPAAQRGIGWQPAWSPDSTRLLVGPTFVPVEQASPAGLTGFEMAVVDIAKGDGSFAVLPLVLEDARSVRGARWLNSNEIEVQLSREFVTFQQEGRAWKEVRRASAKAGSSNIRVELRQDLNTPPALYAVDETTGRQVRVFDPNPALSTRFELGETKLVSWRDQKGRLWEGRLYLPVGYQTHERYPLVIQTRGWGHRDGFSLYGRGGLQPPLGPGWSVFLAQPLANRGIAVLQVGPPPPEAQSLARQNEAWTELLGYESAIDHLDRAGVIDRSRVGLMGFSRSGWHAVYSLAFSKFRYAASIVDDNINSSYIEEAMAGWGNPEMRNGADPFGRGMKDWLENAPSFNIEHVNSPLMMIASSSIAGTALPVVQGWEIFSRLRFLGKPVEYFVAPRIDRGSHNLQNPGQLMVLQQRALDWWLFWLKDEINMSYEKRAQYQEWTRLRTLRDTEARLGERPYLRWKAESVELCDIRLC